MTPCAPACGRPTPLPCLTEIRRTYSAQWNDLALSVQNEPDGWTVSIQSLRDQKTLYKAHRGTAASAKAAGIEFAMFHTGGAALLAGPEKLALALVWKERW